MLILTMLMLFLKNANNAKLANANNPYVNANHVNAKDANANYVNVNNANANLVNANDANDLC